MSINQDSIPESVPGGSGYHAFLLRCWMESVADEQGDPTWRFALVHFDGSQTKKGFTCLEDLVAYLRRDLAKRSGSSNDGDHYLAFYPGAF